MSDMTREEAISRLKEGEPFSEIYDSSWNEALDMAITALENKGDLISRQAVLEGIAEWVADGYADSEADISHISSLVTHLPSVEYKGEWISTEDRPDGFCSKCDRDIAEAPTPYCPYCGAKMTWVGAIHEPYKKGE